MRWVLALRLQRLSGVVQIMKEDDSNWPPPDRVGRQELEVILGDQHISFTTTKLGSLMQASRVFRVSGEHPVSHRYHAPGCPAPPANAVRGGSAAAHVPACCSAAVLSTRVHLQHASDQPARLGVV